VARILVLHISDLGAARERVAAGLEPDQVIFGINHFDRRGHSVEVVPFATSTRLKRVSEVIRRTPVGSLGDLDQELAVLREAHAADLIYCPCQVTSRLLGYLRAAGAFRRPLVWIVHHPLDCGRLSGLRRPLMRALLRGVDAYPAFTAPVANDVAAIAGTSERTAGLKWGPDPDWYPRNPPLGRGVVAAGWSHRDFETFARAAGRTDVPAWIVCKEADAPRTPLGNHTELIGRLSHLALVDLYSQARAIAIPLEVKWPWTLNGLTSLSDALGMGKPVIVTRNPWIDIDVEALGIGIWVEPGDVNGWSDAIRFLDEQPEIARKMGSRARALVDRGEYSSRTFAERLMDIFDRVLESREVGLPRGAAR
jgi:glycosyltransferase involved in cell wall biosynthesis